MITWDYEHTTLTLFIMLVSLKNLSKFVLVEEGSTAKLTASATNDKTAIKMQGSFKLGDLESAICQPLEIAKEKLMKNARNKV